MKMNNRPVKNEKLWMGRFAFLNYAHSLVSTDK